jgi:DNA-binding NarL/FixJ family response regulator
MRNGVVLAMLIGGMALRALIVDDNRQFLDAASALLESQGMTIVAVASTSEEARHRLDQFRPDLVLVDIDLGEENGVDLAHSLVENDRADRPHVILISAYPADDIVDLLDSCPTVGFLSKSSLSAAAIEAIVRGDGAP